MASVTLRKEERKTLSSQEECVENQESTSDDDIFNSFTYLELEANNLTEQREHLRALVSQLEAKAKEEMEKRKRKVEKLNSEVSDLKRKCEKFANWINSESTLGRTKADL